MNRAWTWSRRYDGPYRMYPPTRVHQGRGGMNKRYFNEQWRPFFLELDDVELCTIVQWVSGMKAAFMWEPFVSHCAYELEAARMEAAEEEHNIDEEPEVLH